MKIVIIILMRITELYVNHINVCDTVYVSVNLHK